MSPGIIHRARQHVWSTKKALSKFARPQSFTFPLDIRTGATRALKNLKYFRAYYGVVLWTTLLLILAPSRPGTVFFLMATSKVGAFYLVLLASFPNSILLQRVLNRWLMLTVLLVVVVVEVVHTDAVMHLLVSLAVGVPIVLFHAMFRSRDDLSDDVEGWTTHHDEKGDEEDIESPEQKVVEVVVPFKDINLD